jgi:hypothetical protein
MSYFFEKKSNILKKKITRPVCVVYATPRICSFEFDLHLESQKDKLGYEYFEILFYEYMMDQVEGEKKICLSCDIVCKGNNFKW